MIDYTYLIDFQLDNEAKYTNWINRAIGNKVRIDTLNYVFTSDEHMLKLNRDYLEHDTYTDILTFNYGSQKSLSGEIVISIDRVRENAADYETGISDELLRVMAHGVLHLLGQDDRNEADRKKMRELENHWIEMFHVEQ